MPLETGRGFPEEDELDAEEEEALALITAACLRGRNEIRSNGSIRFPSFLQDVAAPTQIWTEASHQAYSHGLKGVGA